MGRPRYRLTTQATGIRLDAWGGDDEELLRHMVLGTLAAALHRAPRGEAEHWHAIAPWPEDLASRLAVAATEALYRLHLRGEIAVDIRSAPDRGYLGVLPLPSRWSLGVEVQAVAVRSLGVNRSGRLRATLMLRNPEYMAS